LVRQQAHVREETVAGCFGSRSKLSCCWSCPVVAVDVLWNDGVEEAHQQWEDGADRVEVEEYGLCPVRIVDYLDSVATVGRGVANESCASWPAEVGHVGGG